MYYSIELNKEYIYLLFLILDVFNAEEKKRGGIKPSNGAIYVYFVRKTIAAALKPFHKFFESYSIEV